MVFDIIISVTLNGVAYDGATYLTTYKSDYSDRIDTTIYYPQSPFVFTESSDIIKLKLTVSECEPITFYVANPAQSHRISVELMIENNLLTPDSHIVYYNKNKGGDLSVLTNTDISEGPYFVSFASFFEDGYFSLFLPFNHLIPKVEVVHASSYSNRLAYKISNTEDFDLLQKMISTSELTAALRQTVNIKSDTLNTLLFEMEKARNAAFWNWYQSKKFPDRPSSKVTLSLSNLPEQWKSISDFFVYMALDTNAKDLPLMMEYLEVALEQCHPSLYFIKNHVWAAVRMVDVRTRNKILEVASRCKYLNNLTYSN